MPDPLKYVRPGDSLPREAETWNRVFDAVRGYENTSRPGAGGGTGGGVSGGSSLVVSVRNDTGDALPSFSVVALGEPIFSAETSPFEIQRSPLFPGTAPSSSSDPFAVLTGPIAADAVGRAIVIGVAVCDVIVNDAGHGYAVPGTTGGTEALESAASGPAKLIHVYPGTGARRAVVLLPGVGGGNSSGGGTAGGCGWVQGLTAGDCLEARIIGASGRCDCEDALTGGTVRLTSTNGLTWSAPIPEEGEEGQQETLTVCGAPFTVTLQRGDCNGPCLTLSVPESDDDEGDGIEACGPGVLYGVSGTVSLDCNVYDVPDSIERQGDSPIWIGQRNGKIFKILCDGDTWVGSIEQNEFETIGTYLGEMSHAQSIEYNFLFNFFGCPGNQLVVTFTLPKVTSGGGGSGGATYYATRESCDTNSAIFSIGALICPGEKGCGGGASNVVRVQVSQVPCLWAGEGWYCARGCEDEYRCLPAELLDGDQYDPDLIICGGPYEDEATAAAACGEVTVCEIDVPLPRAVKFVCPAPTNGDACLLAMAGREIVLTYNELSNKWEGSLTVTTDGNDCSWVVRMVPVCVESCLPGTVVSFYLEGFYSFFTEGGDNMGCSDGSEGGAYTIGCDEGTLTLNPFYCEFSTGCDYLVQPYVVTEQ